MISDMPYTADPAAIARQNLPARQFPPPLRRTMRKQINFCAGV